MTIFRYQFLIFSTIIVSLNNVKGLYEGDICYHNLKSASGTCTKLDQCPAAIQDLLKGKFPQDCGYVGTASIVCCTGASTSTLKTTTSTRTRTTTTPTTAPPPPTTTTPPSIFKMPTGNLPVGEKSKRACQNYAQLAYKEELSYVLSGDGNDYDLIDICPWENDGTAVIYNGAETEDGEFPHMALIGYGSYPDDFEWKCGGSLISEKFVLTAAHCTKARGVGNAKFVRLGDVDYSTTSDDRNMQQINIKNRIKHPSYKSRMLYHDIALLELEKPAQLNIHVKPICLYTLDPVGRNKAGIITGWGKTQDDKPSSKLLKGFVAYISAERCNKTFTDNLRTLPRGIDPQIQICYGPYENKTDTCQGDSGGPIQIYNKDVHCSYYIFGITSFGKECGNYGIPAGYVNLYPYIKWIEDTVWP